MNKTFKIIEVVGTSETNYEDAIGNAIKQAAKTIKAISWFEVVQLRGAVNNSKVIEYQVVLKLGFKIVD